jgi:hypothetical protein
MRLVNVRPFVLGILSVLPEQQVVIFVNFIVNIVPTARQLMDDSSVGCAGFCIERQSYVFVALTELST